VLIIGVAGMFLFVGRRDQELTTVTSDVDKLALVVTDLARAQTYGAINDASNNKALEDIHRRLQALERVSK
jgi:hypothetical protein